MTLTLLVLGFLVHSGIGGGYIVPTDFETPVKPQVFVQIKWNKNRKVQSSGTIVSNLALKWNQKV